MTKYFRGTYRTDIYCTISRRHSCNGDESGTRGKHKLTHLSCAFPLIHGYRDAGLSAIDSGRVYTTHPLQAVDNTRIVVDSYLVLQVNISQWYHAKICGPLNVFEDECGECDTARHSSGIVRMVVCDVDQSLGSHSEVLRVRKHSTSRPKLDTREARVRS
jgi:hypothetical protein